MMRPHFEIRREHFNLQVQFGVPVFGLFKEVPGLVDHLFRTVSGYGIRLADIKLDSTGESLDEVNLRLSWSQLDTTCRLFLDRVDLSSAYPPFLRGNYLIRDLLDSIASYSSDISYRVFGVTQEVHGLLDVPPRDFLDRFSSFTPQLLGPSVGSGTVFYFGADANRLAGSIALDFSRSVEGGLFLRLVIMYDASQMEAADILTSSQSQFGNLLNEIGLDLREA